MKIHSGKTDATPGESGYDPQALERLNAHFQGLIEGGKIQAACYLLSRKGRVFAHESMGKLTAEAGSEDFMPDSIRTIASITKVFTTTAILQLLEAGKIFLHQPVASIIKEFDTDIHRQITVFHLLTHTSGLKADPGAYLEPYAEDFIDGRPTRENWIRNLLAGPLQYKTGTTWNYSSKGFAFLSEIVSRVGGMDYTDYVTRNILAPLGMQDTHFFIPEEKRRRVCIVSGWDRETLGWTRDSVFSTSIVGGGGLASTVADVWKLAQMMLNGGTFNGSRILGRTMVEAAIKPQIKDFPAHNWRSFMFDDGYKWTCGLGWELKKHAFLPDATFDHEGSGGAGLFVDPGEDFVFCGFYPGEKWYGESWVSPLAIAWSGIL
jgi:CubicO group peptidase (beta-lactamase class C family)